jgi:hypothetical protein
MPLMAPALDDTDRQPRRGRAQGPHRADFGPAALHLAANGELTLVAVLDTGERRVSGLQRRDLLP